MRKIRCGRKGDLPDVDALVYPAVGLADQITSIIHEVIFELLQEEIVPNNFLCEAKVALGCLEIKLDIQFLQEGGDGVLELIFLHLYDAHDFANGVSDARRGRVGGGTGSGSLP